jgi:simple sugar transport system ATP-binding protein
MALGNTRHYARARGLSMNWPVVQADMEQAYGELDLTIPPYHAAVRTLSGGNLQRLILARELAHTPRLILAFYPTRGLDVPSTMAVRRLLLTARDGGGGVLLISEDLGELFSLSDRLLVLYQGRIVGQFKPGAITTQEIGQLMTGAREHHD